MPTGTDLIRDTDGWRTLSSQVHYKTKNLSVTTQRVLTPSRGDEPVEWTVVHRKAAVVIAPMTEDGEFILVRQERVPVRASLWEFPAGQIDEEGAISEAIIRETAVRELREETGYELPPGGELIALGYFFASQGFTDEHCYLFLARGVVASAGGCSPDESEGITDCRSFPAAELRRMIAENEITNANTLSVYARLCARGLV